MECVKEADEGIILEIKAKPNSPATKLYKKEDRFILEIESEPENNKANLEIIKFFRKLSGHDVKILKGLKSKNKTILIENITKEDFETILSQQSRTV